MVSYVGPKSWHCGTSINFSYSCGYDAVSSVDRSAATCLAYGTYVSWHERTLISAFFVCEVYCLFHLLCVLSAVFICFPMVNLPLQACLVTTDCILTVSSSVNDSNSNNHRTTNCEFCPCMRQYRIAHNRRGSNLLSTSLYTTWDHLAGPIPAPHSTRFALGSDEMRNSNFWPVRHWGGEAHSNPLYIAKKLKKESPIWVLLVDNLFLDSWRRNKPNPTQDTPRTPKYTENK